MSYTGKLASNSVLAVDSSGKTKTLPLGGGVEQSNGTLSAKVTWNTAFDIDMTTAVSCSYTTDGTASIAGLDWELWNSTNLVSVGIEPGVGMVIAHGTGNSVFPGYLSNITSPVLRLPIVDVIPGWDYTKELRLWAQYELTGAVANYQGFRIGIGNNTFGTGNEYAKPTIVFEDGRYFDTSSLLQSPNKALNGDASQWAAYNMRSNDHGINNSYISGNMIHLRQQQQCDWYHFSMAPGETFDDAAKRMVWSMQGFGYYVINGMASIAAYHGSSGIASGTTQMAILVAPITYGVQSAGHTVTIRRLRLDYR